MIRAMSPDGSNGPTRPAIREASPDTPRVHVNSFRGLPQVLARFGVPVEPILQVAGLTRQDLDDPERSARFSDLDQVLGDCLTRTQCDHFGLLLGQYVDLQCFGVTGRLARHAPSVGIALRDLAVHFVLYDSGGVPSVAIHGDTVTLAYGIHTTGVRHVDQVYDLSAAAMLNIMRQLCGPAWKAEAVMLPRKRPQDIRAYRDILGAPLFFDAAHCAIRFPAFWLNNQVVEADPLLYTVLGDRAAVLMTRQVPVLLDEVRRAIRLLLMAGGCSRAQVAEHLQMHSRTLGRRLQEIGTTYQAVIDEMRAQMARQLLQDTRTSIARIAAAVGYRDPEVFTRAFRRWTGMTPHDYRRGLPRPRGPARPDTTAS